MRRAFFTDFLYFVWIAAETGGVAAARIILLSS